MFELLGGLSACKSNQWKRDSATNPYIMEFWHSHVKVPLLSAEKRLVLPDGNGKFNMYI